MTMNSQTFVWFVFLALIKNFSHAQSTLFQIVDSHLTAKEGSCAEIQCKNTAFVERADANWYWIKNANWSTSQKKYNGTIVYSEDKSFGPVSREFATRVKYIGTPPAKWNTEGFLKNCSISICNLSKTDSGMYLFRFDGKQKWATDQVNLTVEENPCPITFEKPPVVNESHTITLTCSTLSSCPSNPQIQDLTQLSTEQHLQTDGKQKSTTVSFKATWKDDGKEFSCQSQDNKDTHLIQRIAVTVQYTPRETLAEMSPTNIQEGQTVKLTCSAIGRPDPTFTWFKNKTLISSGAQWTIAAITDAQSGEYSCKAQNMHGTSESQPVVINVTYMPQVEVTMISPDSEVKQGDTVTFVCNVKKSNPPPDSFGWFKDQHRIDWPGHQYDKIIDPEDRGTYTCEASNTVGTGSSQPRELYVKYRPRMTKISSEKNVKVGSSLTLTCDADANPAPIMYSWYRYNNDKRIESLQWMSRSDKEFILKDVQRTDEACYVCNATNMINTGENSEPHCIEVHYPPTNLMLTMDAEVTEGQLITIRCTVESFPQSNLALKTTSERSFSPSRQQQPNTLEYRFNVTSTHTGSYTCEATNSEGTDQTTGRKLVVKYHPKHVMVQSQPGLKVTEKTSLTLHCSAQSYPAATSFIWMKTTDGKSEIIQKNQTIKMNSVSPSDSGLYNCSASNAIGTGNSQQVEVKVMYGPKHTEIMRAAEQPNGGSSVRLICSSHSYPPITSYRWYKKAEKHETTDKKMSDRQNHTVFSHEPGIYYCVAKNEISEMLSDPVLLFVDHFVSTLSLPTTDGIVKALQIVLVLIILVILIFFVYRCKRNISIQGNTSKPGRCSFLRGGNRARGRLNEPIIAGPSTSRDELLLDQPCHPEARPCQPRPDNTPASNINTVYCTVNLPVAKQGPPAQKDEQDESLNYASLQFGKKKKNQKAKVEDDVVYAVTCKKKGPEGLEAVYENNSAAHAAKTPNPWNDDTDTSEDETELAYSQVSFKMKPVRQKAVRESSSSDEEDIQYTDVKI